jgi:hypothetical protein
LAGLRRDAVKLHLRAMFAKFGLGELPQNQTLKRSSYLHNIDYRA